MRLFTAEPLACGSWFQIHFDNVMTQFIIIIINFSYIVKAKRIKLFSMYKTRIKYTKIDTIAF